MTYLNTTTVLMTLDEYGKSSVLNYKKFHRPNGPKDEKSMKRLGKTKRAEHKVIQKKTNRFQKRKQKNGVGMRNKPQPNWLEPNADNVEYNHEQAQSGAASSRNTSWPGKHSQREEQQDGNVRRNPSGHSGVSTGRNAPMPVQYTRHDVRKDGNVRRNLSDQSGVLAERNAPMAFESYRRDVHKDGNVRRNQSDAMVVRNTPVPGDYRIAYQKGNVRRNQSDAMVVRNTPVPGAYRIAYQEGNERRNLSDQSGALMVRNTPVAGEYRVVHKDDTLYRIPVDQSSALVVRNSTLPAEYSRHDVHQENNVHHIPADQSSALVVRNTQSPREPAHVLLNASNAQHHISVDQSVALSVRNTLWPAEHSQRLVEITDNDYHNLTNQFGVLAVQNSLRPRRVVSNADTWHRNPDILALRNATSTVLNSQQTPNHISNYQPQNNRNVQSGTLSTMNSFKSLIRNANLNAEEVTPTQYHTRINQNRFEIEPYVHSVNTQDVGNQLSTFNNAQPWIQADRSISTTFMQNGRTSFYESITQQTNLGNLVVNSQGLRNTQQTSGNVFVFNFNKS